MKKFNLLIRTDIDKHTGEVTATFIFGGIRHTLNITKDEKDRLDEALVLLWQKNRISQGLVPGGRVFGLFPFEEKQSSLPIDDRLTPLFRM